MLFLITECYIQPPRDRQSCLLKGKGGSSRWATCSFQRAPLTSFACGEPVLPLLPQCMMGKAGHGCLRTQRKSLARPFRSQPARGLFFSVDGHFALSDFLHISCASSSFGDFATSTFCGSEERKPPAVLITCVPFPLSPLHTLSSASSFVSPPPAERSREKDSRCPPPTWF